MSDKIIDMLDMPNNNYYRDFKDITVRVKHLWKPVGRYTFNNDKSQSNAVSSATAVLVSREGLDITVGTATGSYYMLRVPCTDELWDNILENQIYRYRDDIIMLRFNESGVAYDYILNANPELGDEEYDDPTYAPAVLRVRDLLKKKKQQVVAPAEDVLGSDIAIFRKKADNSIELVRKPSVGVDKIEETAKLLQEAIVKNDKELEKFDVLDNNAVIAAVKNSGSVFVVTMPQ